MDIDSINVCHELRQRIELRLSLAPVIAATPVLDQLFQIIQPRSLRSICNGFLVWPAGCREPATKVCDSFFWNMRAKRADGVIGNACPISCPRNLFLLGFDGLRIAENSE